jgi:hypothetical protein
VVDVDALTFGAECLAKFGLSVLDRNDAATVQSNPLPAIALDQLLRKGRGVIDAVLRINLRDGAYGHREQVMDLFRFSHSGHDATSLQSRNPSCTEIPYTDVR